MRRTQRKLQFALTRADNCRFAVPAGSTGAIVQGTAELGVWSTVTLAIAPTINGVRGGFATARTLTAAAPSASFTEEELAGVGELEVYHVGSAADSGTFLTIELSTETTPTPRPAQLPAIPFDPIGPSTRLTL